MRLSIDKRDHAYRSLAYCSRFRVYLNGEELFNCVTADTEKGFVIRQWPVRHPRTRQVVLQRSPMIFGAVTIMPKAPIMVVFDELLDIKPVAFKT